MLIKAKQMVNALPSLQKLGELQLPIKKAHVIYKVSKAILDTQDFLIKEEKKLVQKYNVEIVDNGSLRFNSAEDQIKFITEHTKLMEYEIEIGELIELSYEDLGDVKLMPKDFAALDGLINFSD
jgi:hypothetical protein